MSDAGVLQVRLQLADAGFGVPDDANWTTWVGAALSVGDRPLAGIVTVRLVSEDESAGLNLSYRNKSGATNVLAFPGPGDELAMPDVEPELGDLVICLSLACREAEEQGKRPVDHLAHLVVHGTLHLIGYDHEQETDARRMESIEVRVRGGLGLANPCADSEQMIDSRL
jgi:probable rRNA maturation factor